MTTRRISWVRWLLALAAMGGGMAPALAEDSWKLNPDARIEVQTVSAQTTTRDEDLVIDGEAISLRGQVGLALENKTTRLRVEADRIQVFRLGEGRSDLSRDRLTATLEHDLTETLDVQLQARRYDCGSKLGYLEAIVDFALDDPAYRERFSAILRNRGQG